MFDPNTIRQDFPILKRQVHEGTSLVYLDSAATSQKPQVVIDALVDYYTNHNANVHRGIHTLGDESTRMFTEARTKIATFFSASPDELILVRNTTEALNMIIPMWAEAHVGPGDTILSTEMEHHSNLVPWQEFAKRVGCKIEYVAVTQTGELDMADLQRKVVPGVKLIAVTHVSNAVGVINPIQDIVTYAHRVGAIVAVDGAQSAPHMHVDFHVLGCEFYAFSGHKMLGPMGSGGLLFRHNIRKELRPALFGGGMIDEVSLKDTTYAELPDKFIAGTPDVAGAVGLATACDYLDALGMENVKKHDEELVAYALEQLKTIPQVKIFGPDVADKRCGSVAFSYEGVHAHDVAQILDNEGVAVRSGHHCTMPLHKKLVCAATTRASFNVYTTKADINALVHALQKVKVVFGK